jgi:diketogulonate reductase-like aldo/keto reductase
LQSNGIIVIPKSEKVERLKENFNIFDFDLTNEETEQIKKLHTGLRSIDTTQFKMFGNFPVFD